MSDRNNIKEKYGNSNPFLVPDNYFEQLTETVMSQLPEREVSNNTVQISFWRKVKPILFAAAMLTLFFWSMDTLTKKKTILPIHQNQAVAVEDEMIQDAAYSLISVDDFSLSEYMSEDNQQ